VALIARRFSVSATIIRNKICNNSRKMTEKRGHALDSIAHTLEMALAPEITFSSSAALLSNKRVLNLRVR